MNIIENSYNRHIRSFYLFYYKYISNILKYNFNKKYIFKRNS